MAKNLCTAALVLSLSACAFSRQDTNEPLDVAKVHGLVPGKTTATEVVAALGAPTDVVQLGRRTAYRYDATSSKGTTWIMIFANFGNKDTRSDRVWVFFDDKDVLTHYGASFATHRNQYAMPWEDIHEPADAQTRDAERAGLGAGSAK